MQMPFADASFDCVISNGSLHEWEEPERVLDEIHRVLRPSGRFCITDLRRDAALWKVAMVYLSTRPKEMRPGLMTPLHAAYTKAEIEGILRRSALAGAAVKEEFFRLCISGAKNR